MKKRNFKLLFIYIPLLWFLVGFILLPMLNTIGISFQTKNGFSIQNYINYVTNPNGFKTIKNTFVLGVSTVLICGLIGTALAVSINMVKIPYKKIINMLLMCPMMLPGVLIVISFIQLYGESGLITSVCKLIFGKMPYYLQGFWGILFVHAYTQYIYFYMNVSVAMSFIDSSTIESARGMGASKFHIFKTIIFPTILPAMLSSAIITFISGISSFSAPNLIGGNYKVLSTQIMYSKINNYMNIASMQVVLLMLMGISILFLIRYYERKFSVQRNLKATIFQPYKIKSPILSFLYQFAIWSIIILIILPIIATVVLSFVDSSSLMVDMFPSKFTFENYLKIFTKKRVLKPFINSVSMTAIAVMCGLIITIPISYLSVKNTNRINSLLEFLVMLPLTMPVSSIAINLINTFNRRNIFAFNNSLIGTYAILPIAYITIAIPLLLRTNIISMRNFNNDLEYAAKGLGANKIYSFRTIIIPAVMPSILSGAILVYIRTIGEYTMSGFLYGVHNQPVSIAMVSAIQEYDIGLAMGYGTLTIAICFIGMIISSVIENKNKMS
ncbi:MAG: iron ABC transporter permease [Oscillospiraceae bacterium]